VYPLGFEVSQNRLRNLCRFCLYDMGLSGGGQSQFFLYPVRVKTTQTPRLFGALYGLLTFGPPGIRNRVPPDMAELSSNHPE